MYFVAVAATIDDEVMLLKALFNLSNYSQESRPVKNPMDTVQVSLSVALREIVEMVCDFYSTHIVQVKLA